MSMTLQQMRDFVRTHADADTDDAPDSSLDIYARIAYNDILNRRYGWPHLKVSYTFSSVVGQAEYALTALSSTDMDIVSSITVPPSGNTIGRLVNITRADADWLYGSTAGNAYPLAYTIDNETIVLFPTPSAVKVYTVRGYRNATAWPTAAGSTPDLPEVLHEAICWYMLSNYFMAQEDTQMAGVYLSEYNEMVRRHLDHETAKEFSAKPQIMGGQNIRLPLRTNINW